MAETRSFPMQATASVRLAAPEEMLRRLCAHFVEHQRVTVTGARAVFEAEFGTAHLEAREGCLQLEAFGYDDSTLTFVKMVLAEHILEFAGSDKPRIVWTGDGPSSGPLPYFRALRVVGLRDVTPRMRRIILAGEDLSRFTEGGLHVRLLFPPAGIEPAWPTMGEDGRPVWPTGEAKLAARIYTLRRIDAAKGEVEIDFVLHEGGDYPGAGFAAKARPGDIVGMTGPGGGATPTADWCLLAGDETALPAIGRMLEELPASAEAVVRIEVADAAEEQALVSAARLDLQWLHRGEAEAGATTRLEDAVRAVPLPDDGRRVFAWGAAEHKAIRSIRKALRGERGLTRDQHMAAAYWRRGFNGDSPQAGEA